MDRQTMDIKPVQQKLAPEMHQAKPTGPAKQKKILQSITAEELYRKKVTPPEFTVAGLLPVGLTVFAARPKTGKSFLMLDMANAVATGQPFWNRSTKAGDVLYLALEDSDSRMQSRMRLVGVAQTPHLHFIYKISALGYGFEKEIADWKQEKGITHLQLIIIDTIARVKGRAKPGKNAYESDSELFGNLQRIAIEEKTSVICVTHYSKNSRYFTDDPFEAINGSMGLFGVSDAGWVITGGRNSDKQFIITGKDVEPEEYAIEFHDFKWTLNGTLEEIEANAFSANPIYRTACHLLESGGQWTGTATQFGTEVALFTGCDIGGSNKASKAIRHMQTDLKAAGIEVILPPKNGTGQGRFFTFKKRN